jgi:hypothetical protein
VDKSKQLTPRRQGAKTGKVEVVSFLCAFQYFAPLREMLLLLGRFFHTFRGEGPYALPFSSTTGYGQLTTDH